MDEIVLQVINRIEEDIQKLITEKGKNSFDYNKLIAVRDDFAKLFSLVPSTNDLDRLFCRRLARLMDLNKSLEDEAWFKLQEELSFVLQRRDISIQTLDVPKFSSLFQLENKLQQREIQFKKKFGKLKNFDELVQLHRDFLDPYLQKCIELHSTIQVRGLIENIDNLLHNNYQQNEIYLDSQTKTHLEKELASIQIPLKCSYKYRLQRCSMQYFSQPPASDKSISNNQNVFLPGMEEITILSDYGMIDIYERLKESRWMVILGDPGSAKTTQIRLITQCFAEAARQGNPRVLINGIDCGPVRIPILIRIGEFAQWLDDRQDSTLIDYIGKHTWFSESYNNNNDHIWKLKEFIYYGHALILLDGLDEIPIIEQRRKIIKLVEQFMYEFVHGRDFVSPIDDISKDPITRLQQIESPSMAGGNQIIITSRVIGYSSNGLVGPLIAHCYVQNLDSIQADRFIDYWFQSVNQAVSEILLTKGIRLDDEVVNISNLRRQDNLKKALSDTSKILSLHPIILSMICSSVFRLSDDSLLPESIVQLYDLTSRSIIHNWISRQSNISENILKQFQTDLALYLHLNSSSGFIDEFDMQGLSYMVLKQQNSSYNNRQLRGCVDELMNLINSNNSIVVERGLKVFSFIHLSFQEYTVASSLLVPGAIEVTIRNFLTYAIRPRFREPLRLALSWISYMWSSDDYHRFCEQLIASSATYAIPLGTLLFLNYIDDTRGVPSSKILFRALNQLLDHNCDVIFISYFGLYLSILPDSTITKWMRLNLVNEQRINKFCKALLHSIGQTLWRIRWGKRNSTLLLICNQLWLLHSISSSIESMITQTLRKVIMRLDEVKTIFNDGLPQYISSHGISPSNIHPLVLSVIIALYGGIQMTKNEMKFSTKYIHRNSSAFEPIVEYFENKNDSYTIKVQRLIEKYETMLHVLPPTDISNNTIDIFIALICLRGVSQPSIYNHFNAYRALPLALTRCKRILVFLRDNPKLMWSQTEMSMFSNIKSIMNMFVSQSNRSPDQCNWFSRACLQACDRLRIEWISYLSSYESFLNEHMNQYTNISPEFSRLIKYCYRTILIQQTNHVFQEPVPKSLQNVHLYKIFNNQSFLLNFVENSRECLYERLFLQPSSQCDSLPLIVLLSECLRFFVDYLESEETFLTLNHLLPLFEKHNLENYVLALFWMGKSRYKRKYPYVKVDRFDQYSSKFSKTPEILIDEEIKRLQEGKDHHLFTAALSLARLYQVQYRNGKNRDETSAIHVNLLTDESKPILLAINKITDPILRILLTSSILDMKHPFIFNENQSHLLRMEIIDLLNPIFSTLPLLISTLLFIRCHSLHQIFASDFQQFANIIGEQLVSKPIDEEMAQNQTAAYIALKRIDEPFLFPFLNEFEKRTEKIEDRLQMTSVIFHQYFTETTLFPNLDHVLLATMYLAELTVDAQILNQSINLDDGNAISSVEKLWPLFMKTDNVITFEIASLIRDCLDLCSREDLAMITKTIFSYHTVFTNARPVILQWFNCQINESIKPLLYYAVLLLIKDQYNNISILIDRLKELYPINIDKRFENIIRNLLELESIDPIVLDEVLIPLIHNAHHCSMRPNAVVYYREIMSSILKLECERLSANLDCSSTESFLLLLDGCSLDIQIYLVEHLLQVTNADSEIQNNVKEKYLSSIATWIIEKLSLQKSTVSDKLYNGIISFLDNEDFPQVKEAIIISIKNLFMKMSTENIFTNEHIKLLFETKIKQYVEQQDLDSENLLATYLNAYGYCLFFSKKYYPNQKLSDEMLNLLTSLFETSSSPLVSARAGQCLLIIEQYVRHGSVTNWLNTNHVTSEQIYNVYTQCTFDERNFLGDRYSKDLLIPTLLTNSTDLFPKFIDQLYNNLQKISTNSNLHEQTLHFIDIAENLCRNNLDIFRTAMSYCSFNEQQFKNVLYQASQTKNDRLRQHCAQLYTYFGDLTPELVDMILKMKRDNFNKSSFQNTDNLSHMKQILISRETIEKLYQSLELPLQQIQATKLLKHFAQIDFVSTLEVYEQISNIIRKLSTDDPNYLHHNYQPFFITLLELSCMTADNKSARAPPHQEEIKQSSYSRILNDREICMIFERLT